MVYPADYRLFKRLIVEFDQIYKSYWDKVFRLCMGYFNDYSLAQDLAQDIFVRVWQYLPDFKGDSSVGTWIFRIATNVCLRHTERRKSVSRTETRFDVCTEEPVDDLLRIQALYKAIAGLPPMDRLIISLYLEDMKQSEIARITGMSEANVRVRIYRIKSTLAKKLSGYNE